MPLDLILDEVDIFEEKKILAIAGIGNPNNFFSLLLGKKLKVEKKYLLILFILNI